MSDSLSFTHQPRFLCCHREKSPKPATAIFLWKIQIFGFCFSLFPVKNQSRAHSQSRERMSLSLPAPHLIPLCVPSSVPWCPCLMFCTNPAHKALALRAGHRNDSALGTVPFPLNIFLTLGSPPEENDTSSVRME